jgi:hypothetical protein
MESLSRSRIRGWRGPGQVLSVDTLAGAEYYMFSSLSSAPIMPQTGHQVKQKPHAGDTRGLVLPNYSVTDRLDYPC